MAGVLTTLKNHDFHGGGFKSIMHRHLGAALETKLAIDAGLKLTQAIGFDPSPFTFREAVTQAIAEGRIGKESPAALWLNRQRDAAKPTVTVHDPDGGESNA